MRVEEYRFIEVSIDEGIAVVTMGDPVGPDFAEAEHPMHRELCTIWDDLDIDRRIRAIVLTGRGDTFFQGPTLEALKELVIDRPDVVQRQMAEVRTITDRLLAIGKPIVAAVNGTALSIGCQLALLSDEAIATPDSRFQDSHVRLGLAAGDGGTWMWPAMVGYANARRFLLRSHPITADTALASGLIAEVVAEDELIARAREIAIKLSNLPPHAYQATKRALAQWLRLGALLSSDLSSAMQTTSYLTAEFRSELDRRLDIDG
jgi:enoyl-CoA hydratase